MQILREAAVLLIVAGPTVAALAQSAQEGRPRAANVMLCDSPAHAIGFTVAVNEGAADDMAKDIVGRAAKAEVCDKFIGQATIEQQKTLWDKGLAYIVTAYKFKGVGDMKWSAIPKDQD